MTDAIRLTASLPASMAAAVLRHLRPLRAALTFLPTRIDFELAFEPFDDTLWGYTTVRPPYKITIRDAGPRHNNLTLRHEVGHVILAALGLPDDHDVVRRAAGQPTLHPLPDWRMRYALDLSVAVSEVLRQVLR